MDPLVDRLMLLDCSIYLNFDMIFLLLQLLLSLNPCHFDLILFVIQNLSCLRKFLETLLSIELASVYELKLGHPEAIV